MHRFDIVALGEAMVEFNQARSADGRSYLQGFGGDTSNAVIAAARQGARCAYVSRVGDDHFGRALRALWHDEGVDASGVGLDPQAHTGVYFVHHGPHGHRFSYLRARSAASAITPADVPSALIESARVLHVSGISQAISDNARATVAHAIGIARGAGVSVAYDPNLRLALWPLHTAREAVLQTMPLCDEFLPGLDDMHQLSGLDDPHDIVAWSHRHGARTVVLKLGSRGVLVSDGASSQLIAPHAVDAVDATGAGDCFDGSYIARRAAGDDALTAARWANAAAALATTGYGAVEPLPRADAVRRLLHSPPP